MASTNSEQVVRECAFDIIRIAQAITVVGGHYAEFRHYFDPEERPARCASRES
jgi:hypothetical protein